MKPSEQICIIANSKLNTDFTPDKVVPDEVSCAFALTTILHEQDPLEPVIESTAELLKHLRLNGHWQRIYEPVAGCVVVCATGTNSRPDIIPNGHCGIYKNDYDIMSNDSNTGLWKVNYNRDTWRNRYYYKGGYVVYLFQKII